MLVFLKEIKAKYIGGRLRRRALYKCDNCNNGKIDCDNCSGNGEENCEYCGGSGHESCDDCDGTGSVTIYNAIPTDIKIFASYNQRLKKLVSLKNWQLDNCSYSLRLS